MRKSGFFLLILFFLLSPACKSSPPAGEPEPGPESAGTVEASPGTDEAGVVETAEPPAGEGPVEEAGDGEDFPAGNWAEPEPELAETGEEALPPDDTPLPPLPEPDAAALLPPPEPVPAPIAERPPAGPKPADARPPEEEPPDEDPPEPSLPPPPALPPPPPPALRPGEEAPPAGTVREPERPPVQPPPASPEPEIIPLAPPPAPADEGMVFSRIVRATAGQLVEIPFRGTGWVYLGELGARRGVAYDSRRLDPEGQRFIFRAEAAGVYALKFYKQDFIRDYILNDYVQVIVGEAPETAAAGWFGPPLDRGRVSAERWPSALEEADAAARSRADPAADDASAAGDASPAGSSAPAAGDASTPGSSPPAGAPSETQAAGAGTPLPAGPAISDEGIIPVRPPAAAGQAVPPETSAGADSGVSLPDASVPGDYLQKAREEFNAGRVAGAIAALDQFRERFPAGSDEAWWLYGQFYEANSPSRDIRAALDYYRRLVREYPQSRRYTDARRRIAYLERYYFTIQ